jgi:hypothetical protein
MLAINQIQIDQYKSLMKILLSEWGSRGFGGGQFIAPGGLAADSQDNIYAGDWRK